MNPNRSNRSIRRSHSPEFKAQVIGECRQPGASVAAVAIAHSLNPNVVRKWLAGQNLKRMGEPTPATPSRLSTLQFVPLELTNPEHREDVLAVSPPELRLELDRGRLRLKLHCATSEGPTYAALLRALADTISVI